MLNFHVILKNKTELDVTQYLKNNSTWSQKTISELLQELRGKNKDIHILNGKNPQHFLCKQNG